ncbi:alanine racemase [Mycolicibacterium frederiksbergense]|uniref:alanine racemase n=1 Tax=Mycolicibacterium frederiksbergense TaxID=117567 RepID=UPI00265C6465|nr:alanine racemase [Mycolicibacterium frederiksbergense]MDO0972590.1 alanine racemase [Mycolicibacterium frederiksbergense]
MHPTDLPAPPGPTAEVDLGAIAHNVRVLRERAGAAAVMAVVKADGYGHGATPVARTALAAGAAEVGVATVGEALSLRRDGITAPVLAWLHPPGTDFSPALAADVQIAVSSAQQLDDLVDASRRTGVTAVATLKVDTGLSRNGVAAADLPKVLVGLAHAVAEGTVHARGIMSHLACGDDPGNPMNDRQAARLQQMRELAREYDVDFEIAHLSNSPAAMTRQDLAFDMVRPGIAIYGQTPIPALGNMGLRPAMTLKAPVAMVRSIKAGDGVSYGHTWIAERDTTVALIPLGYADGIFRTLSGRLQVSINGRRHPGVGRICMDQFVVDLGPGSVDVGVGDEAILFGPGASGEPTTQDWADLVGTINYEVVTAVRGRITRVYRGEMG